ncbi:MAG: hypothetical protein ACLGIY_24430, partial [Betaproteobacteria bacterium]
MTMPSAFAVARHWAVNWKAVSEKFGKCFLIDLGEPTCFACDNGWNGRYDVNNVNATDAHCAKAWKSAPLERAHIVARQFGGS